LERETALPFDSENSGGLQVLEKERKDRAPRSGCAINASAEVFGDS
jgi:hypothetical protein